MMRMPLSRWWKASGCERGMFTALHRRVRRGFVEAGCESLETRVLLTPDLIVSAESGYTFTASETIASQYILTCSVTIKNQGTTDANLTGNSVSLDDNVQIAAILTLDATIGNGDDLSLGTGTVTGLSVFDTVILEPNETLDFVFSFTLTNLNAGNERTYLSYRVDSTGEVAESDEGNNAWNGVRKLYGPLIQLSRTAVTVEPGKTFVLDADANFAQFGKEATDVATLSAFAGTHQKGDQIKLQSSTLNGETLKRKGNRLLLGATELGTISGGKKGVNLVVSFNGETNNIVVQKVLRNLTFKSKKSELPREVGLQFHNSAFLDGDRDALVFLTLNFA